MGSQKYIVTKQYYMLMLPIASTNVFAVALFPRNPIVKKTGWAITCETK